MPGPAQPTLASLRQLVRDRIDEATASFWPDATLNRWVNDACRDIARRAEVIQSFNTSLAIVAGTNKYTLPADFIRAHRAEFQPSGSNQVYPLRHSTYQEMDQVWGINQNTESAYPLYFAIWGVPGSPNPDATLQIQFYPTPAQTGTVRLFYYRMPQNMAADADIAEIPIGWDDAVAAYAEYMAKRRDHDPDYQIARDEYEAKIQQLIDVSRQWHDQQRMIITPGSSQVPAWLYADDWY